MNTVFNDSMRAVRDGRKPRRTRRAADWPLPAPRRCAHARLVAQIRPRSADRATVLSASALAVLH